MHLIHQCLHICLSCKIIIILAQWSTFSAVSPEDVKKSQICSSIKALLTLKTARFPWEQLLKLLSNQRHYTNVFKPKFEYISNPIQNTISSKAILNQSTSLTILQTALFLPRQRETRKKQMKSIFLSPPNQTRYTKRFQPKFKFSNPIFQQKKKILVKCWIKIEHPWTSKCGTSMSRICVHTTHTRKYIITTQTYTRTDTQIHTHDVYNISISVWY